MIEPDSSRTATFETHASTIARRESSGEQLISRAIGFVICLAEPENIVLIHSGFAQVRGHVGFRINAANAQHCYRSSENGEVIRLKEMVQILFRIPLTHEQGRILIGRVEIKIERAATSGFLEWIKQSPDRLKKLCPLLRLHSDPRSVHNHLVHTHRHL